jgi:ribosomal protein L11 methylase PrmA
MASGSFARETASFRDPSGFVYRRDGRLLRQINQVYAPTYDLLMQSGLYQALTEADQLVAHRAADIALAATPEAYAVIQPDVIPFVSYPYEWSFSQLKQASLLTLAIQEQALKFDLSLKDSSAYNVQFVGSRPILVDTLSFEPYVEGQPWVAYRQFCQHFLAPLALMSKSDIRLAQLLRVYLDGLPLDLASKLLPFSTRFNFGLMSHVLLHAKSQQRYAQADVKHRAGRMGRTSLLGLIDNLRSTVNALHWSPAGTEWGEYYEHTNYSAAALEEKQRLVANLLDWIEPAPRQVWDLGANTGVFSRLASQRGWYTVALDVDAAAVENDYQTARAAGERNLLPLLMDLTNPSASLGWAQRERQSLLERGPVDAALALALIHHLAISNNLPLAHIAQFLSEVCEWLIIEFVPKSDSQVQRLLTSRADIFPQYHATAFEQVFAERFEILARVPIPETERTLYLMRRGGAEGGV